MNDNDFKLHPIGVFVNPLGQVFMDIKTNRFPNGNLTFGTTDFYGYKVIRWKGKQYKVHRLVAECFIPNPNNHPFINHKDENPLNNTVENLEWCTPFYNNTYGTRLKRVSEKEKKKVIQLTLDNKVIKIFDSFKECHNNGFSKGNVCACCNNKYLKEGNNIYKGFKWEYYN